MTKFRLVLSDKTIEFATLLAAQEYKTANGLTEDIEEFTEEIVYVEPVPDSLTGLQLRLALVLSGKSLETIESTIDLLPEPQRSLTRITWEYATIFERYHPMIDSLGFELGLTTEEIDDIFRSGALL